MKSYSTFAEFIAESKRNLEAFHDDLTAEAKLSEDDRHRFRLMIATLGLAWLERSGNIQSLAWLRNQIGEALADRQLN